MTKTGGRVLNLAGAPRTATIYVGLSLDDIVGAAALAAALSRKGYRVYVDLPVREELSNLRIVGSYAVGIQPKSGITIANSVAMVYSRSKRMGYVFRYDGNGNGEVLMKLSAVSSTTEVVKEYLTTISADVDVPKQLLDDIIAVSNGGLDKLSKIGRVLYGVYKLKSNDKNARTLLYNYAYNSILTKNLKLPEELLLLYNDYLKSLKLVEELVKSDRLMAIGPYKVVPLSSKHSDEFVVQNIDYLKPFASEILSHVCRQRSPAFLIYETSPGVHEIKVCVRYNVSIAKVVGSVPREVLGKVSISTSPTSVLIEFNDPREASFDEALNIVTQMIARLSRP